MRGMFSWSRCLSRCRNWWRGYGWWLIWVVGKHRLNGWIIRSFDNCSLIALTQIVFYTFVLDEDVDLFSFTLTTWWRPWRRPYVSRKYKPDLRVAFCCWGLREHENWALDGCVVEQQWFQFIEELLQGHEVEIVCLYMIDQRQVDVVGFQAQ